MYMKINVFFMKLGYRKTLVGMFCEGQVSVEVVNSIWASQFFSCCKCLLNCCRTDWFLREYIPHLRSYIKNTLFYFSLLELNTSLYFTVNYPESYTFWLILFIYRCTLFKFGSSNMIFMYDIHMILYLIDIDNTNEDHF